MHMLLHTCTCTVHTYFRTWSSRGCLQCLSVVMEAMWGESKLRLIMMLHQRYRIYILVMCVVVTGNDKCNLKHLTHWYQWRPLHELEYTILSPSYKKKHIFIEKLSFIAFQRYMTCLCTPLESPPTLLFVHMSPDHVPLNSGNGRHCWYLYTNDCTAREAGLIWFNLNCGFLVLKVFLKNHRESVHLILQEFIIHSPTYDSRKIYIGNALQGSYAAVFAQLYINKDCNGLFSSYISLHC